MSGGSATSSIGPLTPLQVGYSPGGFMGEEAEA